jgi:hypothetical protein
LITKALQREELNKDRDAEDSDDLIEKYRKKPVHQSTDIDDLYEFQLIS